MCRAQKLWLWQNQIGDAGVTALAQAAAGGALAQLTDLYLMDNKISDDGFATLFPLLNKDGRLSGLTGFGIGSRVTDKGMKEFAKLLAREALAQVEKLYLSNNQISDVRMDTFATAWASGGMAHLTYLAL